MTSTRRVTSSGMGRGTTMARWSVAARTLGDVEHVVGLEAEVELLDDGLGEQLDQRRRVGQRRHRDAADQGRGDPAHGGQVSLAPCGRHVGPLHLDHHVLAGAAGVAAWTWAIDAAASGVAVEGGEDLLERAPQVGFDHGPDGVEGLRRDPVPEQLELADQLGGKQPFARREDLARA